MHALYELKDMLCKELDKYGQKGDLNAGSLEIVDKLAHAIKNIDTIIAMEEESGMDESGRYESGRYSRARGRGRYARRDSRGRYSSRGSYEGGSYYGSYDDGMMEDLRELMEGVTDERKRQEFQKFINKIEQM